MKRVHENISPVLVIVLTAVWLLLNQTLALAHVVLGLLLATALAWFVSRLRPLHARVRRLDVAVVLVLVVTRDIVASNFHVALIVLGLTGGRRVRSGFLDIPLDLRDPHGLAMLAAIVTATPGTVWAGLSTGADTLTLHVLDLQDEDEVIRTIKKRYEQRLMRIFE